MKLSLAVAAMVVVVGVSGSAAAAGMVTLAQNFKVPTLSTVLIDLGRFHPGQPDPQGSMVTCTIHDDIANLVPGQSSSNVTVTVMKNRFSGYLQPTKITIGSKIGNYSVTSSYKNSVLLKIEDLTPVDRRDSYIPGFTISNLNSDRTISVDNCVAK